MTRVTFTYNDGRTRKMNRGDARFLQAARRGSFAAPESADAVAEDVPPVPSLAPDAAHPPEPELRATSMPADVTAAPAPVVFDLAALDTDALRALAQERGVKVHHNAGADKIREALRQAKA